MDTQKQDLTAQDIWELFRETNRMFQETDHKFEETDRRFKETDRKSKETDRKFQELAETVRNTNKKVGELTDKWGEFVESMVEPAVVRLFAGRDIPLDGTSLRARRRRNGREMEIDILGANREYVVAVEVKTTLRADDVKDFVRTLDDFKTFFPEYREYKVIGAVAGMRLQKGVNEYAKRHKLYVLAQSGERCPERCPELVEGPVEGTVQILNDEDFEARVW